MKKALFALFGIVAAAAMLAWIAVGFFMPRQRPPLDLDVEITPELVARGTYLVEHVLLCNDCHSERDWSIYGGPPMAPLGAGRECMTRRTETIGVRVSEGQGNFPGVLCIRNITPDPESGIGRWTDGELVRAMREGIDHRGNGLFPIMPYFIYRSISDRDAAAVVAYMRNLAPVRAERPERDIDFPMSLLIEWFPEPLDGPVPHPDESDRVAYGEYLATITRCGFCHTPRRRQGKEGIPGREFAGGVPFVLGARETPSRNLTPHATGIGPWTEDAFIARFRQFGDRRPVASLEENTLMNWSAYAGMTDADLGAIYAFLHSLPPRASDAVTP
ncbi:MAG: cytochrome C [Gammaproteobacteria bacterium]